jgi:hypothetical protein
MNFKSYQVRLDSIDFDSDVDDLLSMLKTFFLRH